MLQEPAPRLQAERQSALWPWFLMPLATLALFAALSWVRHTASLAGSGTSPTALSPDGGE